MEKQAEILLPRRKPLGKQDRKHLRHRWHRRLVFISAFSTILVFLLVLFFAALLTGTNILFDILNADEFREFSMAILAVLLSPIAFIAWRAINTAEFSATGAVVSEQQFEHVYSITEQYSKMAGLKRTPTIAIVSGAGFTAKTTSNFGKAVILVHSDLLDSPRPGSHDWGALRFAIAREIGHIAAGSRGFWYELLTASTQAVPYLANPLLRAEAYTADRYAAVLAPDAISDYFAVDAVSKDCWQDMSIHAMIARAGKVRLGQMITGLVGDVPPTVWRLQALAWLGVFRCEPTPCYAQSPAEYGEYLRQLPTWPVSVAELKRHHGAFLFAPDPIPSETVAELCPKGTNAERLSRAFAAYENKQH